MKLFGKNITPTEDPILNGVEESAKQNPFNTPDGYFDKLSSDILGKIQNTAPAATSTGLSFTTVAAVVVSAVIIATAVYFFTDSSRPAIKPANVEQQNQIESQMPQVVLSDEASEIIELTENRNNDMVVIIDATAETAEVEYAIDELSVSDEVKSYIGIEYNRQITELAANNIPEDLTASSQNSEITVINDPSQPATDIVINTDVNAFIMLPRDTCSESTMLLNAYIPGAVSYVWSTGETTPGIYVNATGNYKVTVTLDDETVKFKTISARIIPRPDLSSDYLITGCAGSSLRLNAEQKEKGYKYYWPQYNLKAPQMTVSRPGLYYVNITGCEMYADSFFVVFTHCELGIPNIISPDGDGINETFNIKNLSFYPNTELYIYDRTNKLVFKSMNYQNDWDASNTPDGYYYFLLRFADGSTQEGLLTVQRK